MKVTVCSFFDRNNKTTIQAQAGDDKFFGSCARITARQLRNAAKRLGVSRLLLCRRRGRNDLLA